MHIRPLLLTGAACLGLALVGCEHAPPVGGQEDIRPTLSSIQTNIFNTSCARAGCHGGSDPRLGLDLSAGNARVSLVNVQSQERPELLRVAPGEPDSSYLIHKVEGRPSIVGEQMPFGQPPLSKEKISALRTWIEEGAQAN